MDSTDATLALIEAILDDRDFSDWPGIVPAGWRAWFGYAACGEW